MEQFFVYVLRSSKDGKWYIGRTHDHPEARLKQHNAGNTVSTKHRRPFEIVYYEMYLNEKDAAGREDFLKSGSGHRFLKKQLKHFFDNSTRGGAAR